MAWRRAQDVNKGRPCWPTNASPVSGDPSTSSLLRPIKGSAIYFCRTNTKTRLHLAEGKREVTRFTSGSREGGYLLRPRLVNLLKDFPVRMAFSEKMLQDWEGEGRVDGGGRSYDKGDEEEEGTRFTPVSCCLTSSWSSPMTTMMLSAPSSYRRQWWHPRRCCFQGGTSWHSDICPSDLSGSELSWFFCPYLSPPPNDWLNPCLKDFNSWFTSYFNCRCWQQECSEM